MAFSELTKAHKRSSLVETDLLSNLPEDLKERILTYLPIKEAGRTSILSCKWRYVWASIPELIFGDARTSLDLDKFVDAILLLHSGPIRKFNLSIGEYYPEAFDRWIVNLSRNGIRELILYFITETVNADPAYMMHSRFFSCDELNYINLTNCAFRVPGEFRSFKLLHTLELKDLKISDGEIEKLISRSPLLKKLKLEYWGVPVITEIDAPNLLSLDIYGTFTDLQVCAPKLCFLYLALEYDDEHDMSKILDQVLGNLPERESLELNGFLEYLCVGPLREGFSLTFNRLKYLNIVLNFETEKDAAFALALFQGAPHLESLHIDVCSEERPTLEFWERVDRKADLFTHLQTVKIIHIVTDTIFSFVKFVLDSALQLETLIIEEDSRFKFKEDDESDTIILKLILLLGRASPNAQIIFK